MPIGDLSLTPTGQLEPLLKTLWLETNSTNSRSAQRQPNDSKALQDARVAIFRGGPVAEWPKDVAEAFLNVGVRTVRETESQDARAINLLASFAVAAELSDSARAEVARLLSSLHIRAQLGDGTAGPAEEFNPAVLIDELASRLTILNLPPDVLNSNLRLETINQIATIARALPEGAPPLDWARVTCTEFLTVPEMRPKVAGAARALGLDVPDDAPTHAAQDGQAKRPVPPKERTGPSILPMPSDMDRPAQLAAYGTMVFDLSAYVSEPGIQLSARTGDQLQKLPFDEPTTEANATLFYAARELWAQYGSRGDRRIPSLVAAIGEFLVTQAASAEQRSNALHLWVAANVARKIRTSSLRDLIKDAQAVFTASSLRRNDLLLEQNAIEACAGECKAFEISEDKDSRDQFLSDNWTDIRSVHQSYLAKTQRFRIDPHPDEQSAWDYLSSISDRPDQTEQGIRTSPDFLRAINRGAADDIYEFTKRNQATIQNYLESRLGVQLGLQHVMEPIGEVLEVQGRERRTLHPLFVEAKRVLDSGDFKSAATLFERLSQRVQGAFSNIAKDYRGFALAKQGVQMPARLQLQEIVDDGFTYPSAYWNLACCILPEEMDQQLAILASGLKHAPHPHLLAGCVYVASFSNEPRLIEWLPLLPYTEALLLYYKLDNEQRELTPADRQMHVLRLGRYALEGEPVMPDVSSAFVTDADVQRYLNGLLERQQPSAFEFWLRCREVKFRGRFQHWESKVDFLEKTERKGEAAKAFLEELRGRLKYFGSLANRRDRQRFALLRETSTRLEKWLGLCMTPDLKSTGFRLFNAAKTFEEQFSPAILLPTTERIKRYYTTEEKAPEAPPLTLDLAQLLTIVGAELQSRFKELGDLPAIRYKLDDLVDGLGRAGDRMSADTIRRLLQQYEGYNRIANEAERQGALQKLQSTLADVKREFQRELTETQSTLAGPILMSLKRVNERIARDSRLLPDVAVDGVSQVVKSDPRCRLVVPVRVSIPSGDGVVTLVGATGILDDGTVELTLRDQLSPEDPIVVRAGSSAILALEAPETSVGTPFREAKVTVEFDYLGGSYRSALAVLPISIEEIADLPSSPYIYNRSLSIDEIEGHFFGRRAEQEAIIASLRTAVLRYVEGIRRAGKSSLLRSIEHEIRKEALPFVPVFFSAAASGLDHVGRMFFNLISDIAAHQDLATLALTLPSEQRCCDNLPASYSQFIKELNDKLGSKKIVVLMDDFNQLIDAAVESREQGSQLHISIVGLLNLIWSQTGPRSPLLWLFAGHRTLAQYKKDLPGPDLWGTLKPAPIDFVGQEAVGDIIRTPLGDQVRVPNETVNRVHAVTAGHPELVQKIAELMLNQARDERRGVLLPADADEAAHYLALYSDDPFAGAWVPEAEFRKDPDTLRLLVEFVRKVPVGGRSDLHTLVAPGQVSEKHRTAVKSLEGRKILHTFENGLGVRARVLDLWLHHRMIKDVQFEEPGSPAIFVDVANLTGGKGNATLTELETAAGDGVAGRFGLGTVLDRIEKYIYDTTKVPIATKWAVNYPLRCPAVMECVSKDYKIENIPEDLFRKGQIQKGADDTILQERITEIEHQYPNVQHFFVVTGDKDYRIKVSKLLEKGKHVHVVSRAAALGNPDTKHSYDALARKYPERFSVKRLEELLESN